MSSTAQTSKKPVTFVLVPGSFVRSDEYDGVVALLQKGGHEVKTIDLLSANDGSRKPPAQTSDDTEHLRAGLLSILDDQDRNVVLAVHSYAGIPGSAASYGLDLASRSASGKTTAVIGLVFIASFIPMPGESLRSLLSPHDVLQEPYKTGIPGEYLPGIPAELASFVFSDITDPAEVAKYHGLMVLHSSDSYSGQVENVGWKEIKTVQIIPGGDIILPVAVQEWMGERARTEGKDVTRVFLEGASHCPNLSQPQFIVDQLVKLS